MDQQKAKFQMPASVNQGSGRMKVEIGLNDGPLRIARIQAGVTQSQLASIIARDYHISFSSTDLSRLERGLSWPSSPDRVEAVANTLDVDIAKWSAFYDKVQTERKKDKSASK